MIVTLITIMVWLLAESRMVQSRTLEAQIVLTSVPQSGEGASEDTLVVRQALVQSGQTNAQTSIQDQIRTATIEIEGSAAGLDRFSRLLQNRIELRIGREIPAEPGIHVLDLRDILHEFLETLVHGVVITSVSPESISVEVDELVTREFPLRVDMPQGVELDGSPRTDPASVRVIAPSSVFSQSTATQASVRVNPRRVAQLAQGRLETIPGVEVELTGIDRHGWQTSIEPGQVDVFVTLRTLTENLTIDRLPIQVLIAPGEIGDWEVRINEADQDLVNVIIAGPADAIDRLRSGEVVPKAFVILTFEDLERRIGSKSAQILGLPQGCRVVSPEITVNLIISQDDLGVEDGSGVPSENPSE